MCRERESVNNSSTKDDSFVLGVLPLNTNDDILSDSFLTFERQIQWDLGFVSKLLNRKSAATSPPTHPSPSQFTQLTTKTFPATVCATMSSKRFPVCNNVNCPQSPTSRSDLGHQHPTHQTPFVCFVPQETLRTMFGQSSWDLCRPLAVITDSYLRKVYDSLYQIWCVSNLRSWCRWGPPSA